MNFYTQILEEIKSKKIRTRKQLEERKKKLCKEYRIYRIPKNAEILARIGKEIPLLLTKPIRSLSGVSVVAIMTKPQPCVGECIYCPAGNAAQSYIGFEPAALRAKQLDFDAYRQVQNRIKQLDAIGHPTHKVELIIMGGTFTAMPIEYQEDFVLGAFNGLNAKNSKTIQEAHEINESAKHRCVGLTFETRPDYCKKEEINRILSFGATRVELGVQNPNDEIYREIKRGHSVKDVIAATKLLKDASLKVCYHLMQGLPFSNKEKDLEMFREICENPDFRPDMIKIYPCLLAKREFYRSSEIFKLYKSGKWKPLNNEEAVDLIAEAKRYLPKWMRVMRIQRDIPKPYIEAGVTAGNLRELVHERCKELGIECRCIRCREIGRNRSLTRPKLVKEFYEASDGEECFISFETKKALFGFLRLRNPASCFSPELLDSALVRELHVYGPEARIGKKGIIQHRGIGKRLLEEAEKQAGKWGKQAIAINSAIGVREYYKNLKYSLNGFYMYKLLK